MTHLEALASKYGTDKLDHGYIPFYEKHLPKSPRRILEIGVNNGASIKMWRDYFPHAEIIGLDLFAEYDIGEVYEDVVGDNLDLIAKTHFVKGDQRDWQILEELRKYNFDVIIDDGSHNSRDQMMTFYGLFNGKQYYIEDLHCCDEEIWRQGLPEGVTAKNIFDSDEFLMYNATYDHHSPIVLIQTDYYAHNNQ